MINRQISIVAADLVDRKSIERTFNNLRHVRSIFISDDFKLEIIIAVCENYTALEDTLKWLRLHFLSSLSKYKGAYLSDWKEPKWETFINADWINYSEPVAASTYLRLRKKMADNMVRLLQEFNKANAENRKKIYII